MRNIIVLLLLTVLFSSCEKEDKPVVLPPPGPVMRNFANMGTNYDMQVYVNLAQKSCVTVPGKGYDLAFEAAENGTRIYLNGARVMFATATSSFNLTQADTVGAHWRIDQEQLMPDSTAIGNWWEAGNMMFNLSRVYVIDRSMQGVPPQERFKKFQVVYCGPDKYTVRYCNLNNSNLITIDIPKDPGFSLMYLDMMGPGRVVQIAPPKDEWDFVFTRYTHEYFDEPVGSPYRFYTVSGGIINIWNNTQGAELKKDSTPNYIAFNDCAYSSMVNYAMETRADVIGYDWKYYDFNDSRYYVYPNTYFIIRDRNGLYYKLRMVDFYDQHGNKGYVTFEYQRI